MVIKKIAQESLPVRWNPSIMPSQGFPPLSLDWAPVNSKQPVGEAMVCITAPNGQSAQFLPKYQRDGSPQQIAGMILQLEVVTMNNSLLPLIIVPYLSEERLLELENLGLSNRSSER